MEDPGLGKVRGQTMVLPGRGFKYHIRTKLFYNLDLPDNNTASTDLSVGLRLVFCGEIFSKLLIDLSPTKPATGIKLLAQPS